MIEYNKNSEEYLGGTNDLAGTHVDGFNFDGTIHLVYDLGTDEEFVSTKELSVIKKDIDSYLWTPYGEFAAQFLKTTDIN
jgi:hypothetical protein